MAQFVRVYSVICALLVVTINSQNSLGLHLRNQEQKPSLSGNRPRGVPYARAALYATGDTFACFDNSMTIPIDRVNDDYCDCADGSDEPGTSACANGIFHCLNRGHQAIDIPSGRVNDQICDCCDGSDEWDSGVSCSNICEELGAKHREERRVKIELIKKGYAKRQELAAEGTRLRLEKQDVANKLSEEKNEVEDMKDKAAAKKAEIESKESEAKKIHMDAWNEMKMAQKNAKAQELFDKYDVNNDKKIDLSDLKNFKEFDKNADNKITDDEIKHFLEDKDECDFETFVNEVYDRIIAYLDLRSKIKEENKVPDSSPKDAVKNMDGNGADEVIDIGAVTDKSVGDGGDGNDLSKGDIGEEGKDDNSNVVKEGSMKTESEDGDEPPYDEETKALILEADEIRKEYDEVEKRFRELETSLREAESFVNDNYGSDLAWLPLKGECYSLDERQYTYKVCLFDYVEQKERNGQSITRLGTWSNWTGNEDNQYDKQMYDKGLGCWNGPERSALVTLDCAEETELIEASEPSKCEYHLVLNSPAACPDPASITDVHNEL